MDTVKTESGNSILIYFKPKEKKETLGIEGVLYIDNLSFALTKAMAELKGMVNVKATQNYSYIKPSNIWFPQEMDLVLKKGDNKERISLFGGSVKFGESKKNDSIVSTKNKSEGDVVYFISKATNSNIEINTPIVVKSAAPTIQFNDDAAKKKENFWDEYRTDSITERGKNTYKVIDSIVKVEGENIEQKINIGRNILNGIYPTKYINLNLGKILNFNNYEGFRIGFGGETNSNFSDTFKLESYLAYGTKDTDFKYTLGTSFRLNKNTNTWIGANYTNDIKEAASLDFIAMNSSFSLLNLRNLNLSQFYNYKTVSALLKHDFRPNLEAEFQLSTGDYNPLFNYQYISSNKNLSEYSLTTAIFGFQYNPKNEYMNSPIGKLRIKNEFPQFTFQFTKSFENVMNGDFNFTQVNFQAIHEIKRLQKATTSFFVEGGIVFGDAPISHLFNSSPNATFKNPWANRINFVGKNSFETMGYNEFISDRFAAIHIKHELKPFKIGSKFKPQLIFVTRAAIGDIDYQIYHNGLAFKSLKNGYLESGLELKSLFKGFGLSTFYRYGFNRNAEWSDNLAVKISYKISLGF